MPDSRLIAIDPSLRCSGYAVLESDGRRHRALEYGVIRNHPALRPSACLVAIHERVRDLLGRWQPAAMAIESVIYVQSHRTAIALGAARGCAILAAAQSGLPIHEYAPRRVKQAVVGVGSAQKGQVAFMVRALLQLTETPPADAADALAIGLTHLQTAHTAARRSQPHESI
ncbi:MAG: crossover junction endodeoxyribonuclease RuvC [Terrimicrobiaceae bacterium]|nr:crossover junction endodeoxyribonuclease RuvC [Terrimicrobiaceae bacterium]